ncbi:MAG: DUF5069 domain-containing protein [Candidatus Eremiobacteraeota bacterium]|nr:DUF5069 domain-containing protein [Candidatus Eremiobacteraeota bacterium]
MNPLDLTLGPPRAPRTPLAGLELLMLARTVDKMRAELPGGNLGSYQIPGLSTRLLDALGISHDALREAVAHANSDEEIAAWVRAHSDPSDYSAINAALQRRTIADRLDDAAFVAKYPIARTLAPETPLVDFLVRDDDAMFQSG